MVVLPRYRLHRTKEKGLREIAPASVDASAPIAAGRMVSHTKNHRNGFPAAPGKSAPVAQVLPGREGYFGAGPGGLAIAW